MPLLGKLYYMFNVMIKAKLYITNRWLEKLIPDVYEQLDDHAQLDIYDLNDG